MPFSDEFHLRQRKRIETLIGLLKEKYHLVTSKHRSIAGFLASVFSSLCAYQGRVKLEVRHKPPN